MTAANMAPEIFIAKMASLCGDIERAQHWYFNEPLREFDGKAAATVVAMGRGSDILRLIEMYAAGSAG